MSVQKEKIAIFGLGNMGAALASGLLKKDSFEIFGYDIHEEKSIQLAKLGLHKLSLQAKKSFQALVLCIKPQDLATLAPSLQPFLSQQVPVISILAGVTLDDLAEGLKYKGPIVRVMSNIPAQVLCAASVLCANGQIEAGQKALAEEIFASVGECYWAKEALLDAVTGLSGSGPAYIYMVIEALTDGGVKMGLPRDLALNLATQTVLGSAMLVKKTRLHPAILKDQVTTPGGTTISAIHELEAHGLRSMLISAVATATERSKFLRTSSKIKKE